MSKKKWIKFRDTANEDAAPEIEVSKSSKKIASRGSKDEGEITTIKVNYSTSGAWEGTVEKFQKIEIPETTLIETEGAPSIPKDGIFVALPLDAEDIEVNLIDKSMINIDHEVEILPAPKQYIEEEFQEVYEPDSAIYNSDDFYPGHDFDFLGVKTIDGVKVAHIMVYLGQYKPQSKQMKLVQSLLLEVSYRTPPASDRKTGRKPRNLPEADLILGLDQLDEQVDYSSRDETFEGEKNIPIEELEDNGVSFFSDKTGLSFLEENEDMTTDPNFTIVNTPTHLTPIPNINIEPLLRPKLKLTTIIAEYIIITTQTLESAVEPLLVAKKGWPHYARVVLTNDIEREFSSSNLKESIKEFITWATNNWRSPPRFVVLAGDTNIIPIHIYERGGESYASDHFYADISGNLIPELTVSRLPISNASKLKSVCEHIARYKNYRKGDWGEWQKRVMLSAYQSNTYEETCDIVNNKIKKRYSVIKRYAKNTSKNDLKKTMNDGVLMALYRGHGSKTAWSSSNGLNTNDVKNLKNRSHPPFILNICCQNGWIDDNNLETITETFIREEKAISVFASSRNSWTYPNNDFIKYIFDAVMTGSCQTPAAIIRYAKTKMVRNHGTSSYHLDNTVMYNLFGDPTAAVASNAEWLRGNWSMDHDGWKGTLKVSRIWRYRIENDSSNRYAAPVWNISGTYVSSSGKSYIFKGTLGGFDKNQLGSGSKRSDHKIDIHIKFSNSNNQRFVGYIHTWSLSRISGLTWWSNHPFGWTAQKES